MTVTKADLKQLAGQLRLAGELLEADGEDAWKTMDGWEAGPAAANTDPHGGNRVDDDGIPITLTDRTGDSAVLACGGITETSTKAHLVTLLDQLSDDSGALIDLLRLATPHMPKPDKQQLLEKGLIEDGWCVSCYRDNKHLQPIELKDNGIPYYFGLCRWCGEFKSKNGRQLPPIEILAARHAGRRVSVPMVQRALARQRKKKSRR